MGWYVLVTGDARAKGHFFVVQKRKLMLQSSIESFSRMNLRKQGLGKRSEGLRLFCFLHEAHGLSLSQNPRTKKSKSYSFAPCQDA